MTEGGEVEEDGDDGASGRGSLYSTAGGSLYCTVQWSGICMGLQSNGGDSIDEDDIANEGHRWC